LCRDNHVNIEFAIVASLLRIGEQRG
jgi:hypothetical protein